MSETPVSRTEVLARVIELTRVQVRIEAGKKLLPDLAIDSTTKFSQLGLTEPIVWVDLSSDFEQEWDIAFPEDICTEQLTIGHLVDFVLRSIHPK